MTVFGRPFVKRFADVSYQTVVCLSYCLSIVSCLVCNFGVLRPNGCIDQHETWRAYRPRPWPHCVICALSFPSPKRGRCPLPSIRPMSCGQTAGFMKTPLGTEVELGLGHIVLVGQPPPTAKGAQQPPVLGPCLLWLRSPMSAITAQLFYPILYNNDHRSLGLEVKSNVKR